MPTPAFHYQPLLELGADDTEYRLLTKDHVRVEKLGDKEMLVVDPEALTLLANQAFHDINFFLRPKHLKQRPRLFTLRIVWCVMVMTERSN